MSTLQGRLIRAAYQDKSLRPHLLPILVRYAGKVYLGPDARQQTWQQEHPQTTSCCRCGATARLGFVMREGGEQEPLKPVEGWVYEKHPNDMIKGKAWLHDRCSVAVYFCTKCLEPTALYNQG